MTAAEPAELLDLAVRAAVAAGRMLTEGRGPGRPDVVGTKSSPTDVVTEMDRASEKLIIAEIRAARPGDAFLGEEGGAQRAAAATDGAGGAARAADGTQVRWIIDPIDGTVNYLYGLPDWAVSIAAEHAGEIVAGAVGVPQRGELFTAVRGGGAFLRRAAEPGYALPLRCASGVPLAQALVATGFGYAAARRAVQGEVVAAVLPRVRDIRRGGSCAVDLCALAAGRVDAYYERGINYWDRAAGGLIAEEAGASVAGLRGKPAGPDLTLAAGPGLFTELHDLLVTLDPERDG
ncbi:MAG TPA: inositol monophosphatase family protein [Streptosporangiaceae bacterium]|nr:inositol monophosphatase family protein [Streptosporangiaceae bacterium]